MCDGLAMERSVPEPWSSMPSRVDSSCRGRSGAFTLLEVMISVLIIALIVTSIYRFVEANLMAIQTSTELAKDRQSVVGLVNYVQDQLAALPQENPNVLTGE